MSKSISHAWWHVLLQNELYFFSFSTIMALKASINVGRKDRFNQNLEIYSQPGVTYTNSIHNPLKSPSLVETYKWNFHYFHYLSNLRGSFQCIQTLADTSSTASDLSFFFGGSWAFCCRMALLGTKIIYMFLSLKFLASSVASCKRTENKKTKRCSTYKNMSEPSISM